MNFWNTEHPEQQAAVVDAQSGQRWTYGELHKDVEAAMAVTQRAGKKSLQLLLAQNRYECLVAYLAALRAGDALLLVDATLNRHLLLELVTAYRPDVILAAAAEVEIPSYRKVSNQPLSIWQSEYTDDRLRIHESLALLLTTSGSTGSPKLVRLSLNNLQSNAESIATYLELTRAEKPVTSLPMAYSYGLSVINSHLLAGACLVLTDHGIVRREFWDTIDRHECTSLSGVPVPWALT